jgi:hypothetical protein
MVTFELSVVQVSYKNFNWIIKNIELITRLNKNKSIDFIIIDNDNLVKHYLNLLRLTLGKLCNLGFENRIRLYRNSNQALKTRGSVQHALALDKSKNYITTEMVVIIDPDCYILFCNWIDILLKILKMYNLDLLGFPEAKSDLNSKSNYLLNSYRFTTPCAYFIIGKSKCLYAQTFMPGDLSRSEDTGFQLGQRCLKGLYKFAIFNAYSSRNLNSDLRFVNIFSCTFYKYKLISNKTLAVHFGRGSNAFGKNRSNLSNIKRFMKAITEPFEFRKNISLYTKTLY